MDAVAVDPVDDEVVRRRSSVSPRLPVQRTSFVGRRRERRELRELTATARLVTLLGAAGSGKSRLAQRVLGDATIRDGEGAWYVGLGSVPRGERLAVSVAEEIGLPRTGSADLASVAGWFASRAGLLLLDDCEHLTDACAELVDLLVEVAPDVRVLTTSRQPLGVNGEALWTLTPLQVPRGALTPTVQEALRWDAVQLLVERVTAVRQDFGVSPGNVDDVVTICRRLDGLPLALELAAARFSHLSAHEIADRLDDRFRLLTSNVRAGAGRHRTLREAIDWSHDLLDETEQAVLRRAAVFFDGCTVTGAEAVCGSGGVAQDSVLEALASLTAKSFLVADVAADTTRYRFLETVRHYAREQLERHGEVASTLERHARWHHRWITAHGREDGDGLAAVIAAHDDLAAAIRWASGQGEADLALGLCVGFWRACEATGHLDEGRSLLDVALGTTGWTDAGLRSRVLDGAASLAMLAGDLNEAGRLYTAVAAMCRDQGDPMGAAAAMRSLGLVALLGGDVATARIRADEALEAFERLGDERGVAFSLSFCGLVHRARGETVAARAAFTASLERLDRLGLDRQAADVLSNLGDLASDTSDLPEARACYQAAGQRYVDCSDARGAALARSNLALVVRQQGDLELAVETCSDAVHRFQTIGDRQAAAAALNNLANLTVERGDRDLARTHYEASLALYTELGDTTGRSLLRQHLAELDRSDMEEARTEPLLTPREGEVVGLVAGGLTNRDIAQRLYISERTVESHIAHVRRKLGVSSRTQLVRWALERRARAPTT